MNGISWSRDDVERLRRMTGSGLTMSQIAASLGRTDRSVRTQLSRMKMHVTGLPVAVREAIVEYARQGWAPSRIARQTGVDVIGIQTELDRRGIVVKPSVRPRPTGRLPELSL